MDGSCAGLYGKEFFQEPKFAPFVDDQPALLRLFAHDLGIDQPGKGILKIDTDQCKLVISGPVIFQIINNNLCFFNFRSHRKQL